MTETAQTTREYLKRETSSAHRALEVAMRLSGADASRAGYTRYLRALISVHEVVEPKLLNDPALLALLDDLPSRSRIEAGKHDLASLGATQPLAPFTAPLPMATLAQKLGVLYVIEGSTLGSQLLRRELKSSLGLDDESLRYVNGYGKDTGPKWKYFLAALERGATTDDARAEAASAARATFEQLQHFFDAREAA